MKFSSANVTSGQTRTLSAPDYDGNIVASINNQYLNYVLSSNGTSAMWNPVTTSVIGDFALSSIAQNDYLGVNLSTVNSITTSAGIYYFTNNISSRTLMNGDPNFSRVVYGNGKYVGLYCANTLVQVYTSNDGLFYTYQNTSNIGIIIQSNYNAPYLIFDGSKCLWILHQCTSIYMLFF